MATITLQGNPIHTVGDLPALGSAAPAFSLTNTTLEDVSLEQFAGKTLILNIYPSVDTGVCAQSTRRFNALASEKNLTVLNVSADLPFAHSRFCGAEGLNNVTNLSTFRSPRFGQDYGLTIADGALKGLLSRAVVVIKDGKVTYTEQVPEIAQEPNYDAAVAAASA
ncbi:thiol peroxidase [Thiolinea disciformis]|uniref:thiol peroxidase n=1 Tax=Thiolinea disciformis TaxID=125614 RepID=UPI00037B4981|nr:thiol peroxidase [Thiolinea disciformis]